MKVRDDVSLGQHSHVGMARTSNEDFFGYWESDEERTFDLKGRLVIVCDGMGGHAGGEIASRLAVKTIIEAYQVDPAENIMDSLRNSIEAANKAVFGEAQKPNNKLLKGMGTTVTAVVQRRDMIYFGQVGDSRAYLIRGDAIRQMTKDHSLVQQLVDEGLLDPSEMESHPDKNVILRSLGVKPEVEVDISYAPLSPGDIYLLCSDGLSGLVSPDEMLRIVRAGVGKGLELRKICEQLIDLANSYGGHDNITVQLLKINRTDTATTESAPQDTITLSFSPEEVMASVAKARAEAAERGPAKGDDPPAGAGAEGGKPAKAKGALAATQPSRPAAQVIDAPAPLPTPVRSGATPAGPPAIPAWMPLVLGAALGLFVGLASGLLLGKREVGRDQAKAAQLEANTAAGLARDAVRDRRLLARAEEELKEAETALGAEHYSDAHMHYRVAATLFRLAGGPGDR